MNTNIFECLFILCILQIKNIREQVEEYNSRDQCSAMAENNSESNQMLYSIILKGLNVPIDNMLCCPLYFYHQLNDAFKVGK